MSVRPKVAPAGGPDESPLSGDVETGISNFLTRRYTVALLIIAVTLITSHLLMLEHMGKLKAAGSAINYAGRQRMLSQRLTKEALLLESGRSDAKAVRERLRADASEWRAVQVALSRGDVERNIPHNTDARIAASLATNQEAHDAMLAAIEILSADRSDGDAGVEADVVSKLLAAEPEYLRTMDGVVFAMAKNANEATATEVKLSMGLLAPGVGNPRCGGRFHLPAGGTGDYGRRRRIAARQRAAGGGVGEGAQRHDVRLRLLQGRAGRGQVAADR